MSVFNATTVLAQFHANIAGITNESPARGFVQSAYRFDLEKEPLLGQDGHYTIDLNPIVPFERKWGSGETIVVGTVSVRVVYLRGGGDAQAGDNYTVRRKAADDAQIIADVCENPENYNASASGISIVVYEGSNRVANLAKSEIWESRFSVKWRSDLHTSPVSDLMVASLIASTTTELSALNVLSLASGTTAYVLDEQSFYNLHKDDVDAPDAPDVAATGGGTWVKYTTTATSVWTRPTTDTFRMVHTLDSDDTGVRIQTNPVGSDVSGDGTTKALEIKRKAIDGRAAANAQNGPVVVGITIGVDPADGGMVVDAGDGAPLGNIGAPWSRAIPLVIQPANPVTFNGAGSPQPITRHAQIIVPNSALQATTGIITVGRATTVFFEGAPDNDDGSVNILQKIALEINADPLWVNDSVWWGQAASSAGFEDARPGGEPAVSAAGHIRRKVNTTTFGWDISVDADAWRPQNVAIPYYTSVTPSAQTFPVGDTIVGTVLPVTAKKGLVCWDPQRWSLPAAQNISGGQLVPKMRFHVASGSIYTPSSNTTLSGVDVARGDVYIAAVGSYIIRAEFIVTNTSLATSASLAPGTFQFEGMAV